jgi:hypothetical protein
MSVDICRPQAGEGGDSSQEAYHVAQSSGQLVICATARTGDTGHAKVYKLPTDVETLPVSGLKDGIGTDPAQFNDIPLPDTTLSSDPYYLAVWNADYSESLVNSFFGGSASRTECACITSPPPMPDSMAQGTLASRAMDAPDRVPPTVVLLATPLAWNLRVRNASGDWKDFNGHWYLALKSTTFGSPWIWENTKKDKNSIVPKILLSTDNSPVAKLFTLTFPLAGHSDTVYYLAASSFRKNKPITLTQGLNPYMPYELKAELG